MRYLWTLCIVVGFFTISAHGAEATAVVSAAGHRHRVVLPPQKRPSSAALIDSALAAGTINAEQALTYKVFADFDQTRLPAQFHGDDSDVTEADSPGLALVQWPTLSTATQDLIGPYLVPPFYEGSWWDLRRAGTTSVRTLGACRPWAGFNSCSIIADFAYVAGDHVRVWYDKSQLNDSSIASDLVHETDVKIWAELIKVTGREPIVEDQINGKTLLDVVLVDNLADGVLATTFSTAWAPWSCTGNDATFIAVTRSGAKDPAERRSAFAHELFHAVQHAYKTKDCLDSNYKWLMESTATWFEDEIYPTVNREHDFAKHYLQAPDLSIDDQNASSHRQRNYGAYVFFFYLTRIRSLDPTQVVRFIWEATESADAIHALDAGLKKAGAPLDQVWPEFAVESWNSEAPYNLYQTVDGLGAPSDGANAAQNKAEVADTESVQVAGGDTIFNLPTLKLPHLSMRYYRFDFPDATASSVAFYNGIQRALKVVGVENVGQVISAKAVGDPNTVKGAHLDALVKIDGKWTHEDWSGKPFRTWCRDSKAERIDSVVIILSNSDIANDIKPQGFASGSLEATNIGCWAWNVSAQLRYNERDAIFDEMQVANLRLDARGDVPQDADTPTRRMFGVTAGSYSWAMSGTSGGCGYSGSLPPQGFSDPGNFMFTFPYVQTPELAARGFMIGLAQEWLKEQQVVQETCGSQINHIVWSAGAFFLITTPDMPAAQVKSNGRSMTIDVSKLLTVGGKKLVGTWTFNAVRE